MNEQTQQTPGNVVAIREEQRQVAHVDTDSWRDMAGPIFKLAVEIANTEFVPRGLRGKAPAAAAAMLYGREVGLPPMTALNSTHVIDGSPSISAEMMRAMVLAEGHDLEFVESTGAKCIVRGRRRGGSGSWATVEWTIDMARAAGLLGKDNWKHYPRRMLQARASAELCEMTFPDVIHGFKAAEELQDASDGTGPEDTPAEPSTVQRSGGTRRRAVKRAAAAPPQQAATDDVPLPGESGFEENTSEGGDEVDEIPLPDETGAEQAPPEAPSPASGDAASQPPESGGEDPASGDRSDADEGGPEDAAAGPPASPDEQDADPDGAVDAEVVGEDKAPPPRAATGPQMRALHAMLNKLGYKGEEHRDDRLAAVSTIVGREVTTTSDLTHDDASALIDTLATCKSRENLDTLLQGIRDTEAGA